MQNMYRVLEAYVSVKKRTRRDPSSFSSSFKRSPPHAILSRSCLPDVVIRDPARTPLARPYLIS